MAAIVFPIALDRKNYDDWSYRIKTYLLAEDLWDVIGTWSDESPTTEDGKSTDESPTTEDGKSKAWKKKDAKALYAIQNSCGDDTYQFIKSASTAKEAWHNLKDALKPNEQPDEIEVLDAYAGEQSSLEAGSTGGPDESNHNSIDETFANYVKSNDWYNVIKFLRQHSCKRSLDDALVEGVTVLHYAIRNFKSCGVRIIQLVELMEKEVLEEKDSLGYTVFYHIIKYYPERVEVAACMVKKNNKLLTILPSGVEEPPVVLAQGKTKGERMARYLYSLTSHKTLKVSHAAQLISLGFNYNRFDIAWDLIQRYPKLAMAKDSNGDIPLVKLAMNRFAFKSGSRLSLWEKLIYYGIRIKPLPSIDKDKSIIVEKPENDQSDQRHLSDQKENQRHLIFSGINRIYQMKLMHERVKQFLAVIVVDMNRCDKNDKLDAALCVAAERGHVEYITHLHKDATYPIHQVRNEKGQNLLQIAAECRHHEVYNLLYDVDQLRKNENIFGPDKFGNNMLHTVASITPLSQIDHIQGAALQMQRELQWFKEVESVVDPQHCESENKNNKTPREVFTENHKDLGKEAEKSMKETATSCTVVGALIVTIMFAAAFTVPGENDQNDEKRGLPTFLTNKVFTTFIVSDAISLFSSTTSVIMFLGILTSRYSEADFHKSLPTKMIIGLFTLFLSIATMMIVFSCGLYIMLDGKSSIVIPSILLASVPITSFILMQFPLLAELFNSTFGRRIFDRKQKNLF